MADIGVVAALITLALTMLAQLVGFVWWAATLTSRLSHVEDWVSSNNRISERLGSLETKLISIDHAVSYARDEIGKVFDKLDDKADKP